MNKWFLNNVFNSLYNYYKQIENVKFCGKNWKVSNTRVENVLIQEFNKCFIKQTNVL